MKPFLALFNLTVRHAVRSSFFLLLVLLLFLTAAAIPATVGAGSPVDFIRVSLLYSLSAVSTILALSSVWLGCYTMGGDVESYQLHMVVSKPVSRLTIWLAKWLGVAAVNLVLLFLAALMVYFIVLGRVEAIVDDLPLREQPQIRSQIENEVLVGRRAFMPERPDLDEAVRQQLEVVVSQMRASGQGDTSGAGIDKLRQQIYRQLQIRNSEVPYGIQQSRFWEFRGLPENYQGPVYFRYRPIFGQSVLDSEMGTRMAVLVGVPKMHDEEAGKDGSNRYDIQLQPYTDAQQMLADQFHEQVIRSGLVAPDGRFVAGLCNMDEKQRSLYFQPVDGPMVMIKICGFAGNYARSILVIALELLLLSGLACAMGGCMSMPMAIFVVASYLFFGTFAAFVVNMETISGIGDKIGMYLAKAILAVVIPLQKFDSTDLLSSGELVEWSLVGQLFWKYLLCRALPIYLFGIWIYHKRELGLVIRK